MEEKSFEDYRAALKRHRLPALAIAAALLLGVGLIALLYPATYRSTATILIEEQEIPTELVRSTITTFAAQRLQTISQRVMTRANLERIIGKFELYPKERKRDPMEEVVKQMRKDISFEPISAEVIDPRTGQPSKATIAFSLSYDGPDPALVQRVANEVTSLYLEENLKSRTQKTAETSGFLEEEARHMGEYVSEVEKRLAEFKESHLHSLPEHKDLNLQFLERTERELSEIDYQIRGLDEKRVYLDSQLALIKPESNLYASTGERILAPADRLKALKTQYLALASKYSERHPDVVKAKQEMEAMQREVARPTGPGPDAVKRLTELRTEAAARAQRYSAEHPDVVQIRQQIQALEESLAHPAAVPAERSTAVREADNPAYITLESQRNGIDQDLAMLAKKKGELRKKIGEYETRLMATPDIERQYLELVRDYDNATHKFRELKAKELEAKIGQELEKKSKGERFSIIEPPMLPEKPVKPNRIAIGLLGVFLALGAGIGYVLLRESIDTSIRGAKRIAAITGHLPLAVVPIAPPLPQPANVQWARLATTVIAAAGALVAIATAVHFSLGPLDVLWFRLLRQIERYL